MTPSSRTSAGAPAWCATSRWRQAKSFRSRRKSSPLAPAERRWAISHEFAPRRDLGEAIGAAMRRWDIDHGLRAGLGFVDWRTAFCAHAASPQRELGKAGRSRTGQHGRLAMKTLAFAGALMCPLLAATALTPAQAADMTHERALNAAKEPHNWLLHHGNFEGWRFSPLKSLNSDNVKNLKVAFTVALGGYESGGRYKHGNLQGTPIIEDGMMYVTDGWGSVYAIDVTSGKKGVIKWKFDPGTDRAWAGDVACCGVNNRGVALWKDKVISISLDGRLFSLNKATGEMVWERKVADPAI